MKVIPRLIIPEVYSEALTYYEQLKCLTNTVNDIINLINNEGSAVIKERVIELLNEYFIETIYNENNEEITIKLEEGVK